MTLWKIRYWVFGLVLLACFLPLSVAADKAPIEQALLDELAAEGTANFFVKMEAEADLSAAYEIADWKARGEYVYSTLQQVAAESQASVLDYAQKQGLDYRSFLTTNSVFVRGGNLDTAEALAALPGVAFLRLERILEIPEPIDGEGREAAPEATITWGILDTQADQVWGLGVRGGGIKVANIDTGVQWDHPALVNQFACPGDPANPDCWEDPSNICPGGSACDNHGHGTHTMGTMVALDDPGFPYIGGMAPDATWIACKGCESGSCSDFALNACADWIVAPDGDPANRPHVVNNSWGGGGCDAWYLSKVQSWRAAGIFPAFSSGNSSGCGSVGSPGDYQESFSSTGHTVSRSHVYSQGPSCFGHDPYTKPNITAPSYDVYSTLPTDTWGSVNGTSMGSPHSAGAVALVWSACPDLIGQLNATFEILQDNADPPDPPAPGCGVPPDGEGTYEDGYGYLNALAAVQACYQPEPGCYRILFDETHGETEFTIDGRYSELAAHLRSFGHVVEALQDPNPFDYATISQYDVLVLVLPFEYYSSGELGAIQTFVYEGGRLVTISEWGGFAGVARDVLNDVHGYLGDGLYHNDDEVYDPTDFEVNTYWPLIHNFSPDPVNAGVGMIVEYFGSSLDISGPAYGTAFGDDDTYAQPSPMGGESSAASPEAPAAPRERVPEVVDPSDIPYIGSPGPAAPRQMTEVASLSDIPHTGSPGTAVPGDVIENFANTWDVSSIGLVYDQIADGVLYAHESEPNPTLHYVDYSVPHTWFFSWSLSALNPNWPPTLDNRDGAAHHYSLDHVFLTDYNGDLSIADDNIVEIQWGGTILNAWETDGAGNDSYDGSVINAIIDIAVVPGAPDRYFVAAAGDGSLVYEIDLIKAGWWAPDSWGTLGTCSVPGLGDNVGIDFDVDHGVMYHSDFNSTTIVVTDLNCNVLDTFTCNSPAGFNTGVTFIEGKSPPEIWVTDFSSNSTTRCEALAPPPAVIVQAMADLNAGDVFAIGDGDLWSNDDWDGDSVPSIFEYNNPELAHNVFAFGQVCSAGVCIPARSLSCGASDSWNNGGPGSTDQIDTYSCSSWDESGPEYAYTFVPNVSGQVDVVLSGMTADLDIFVLHNGGGCYADNCIAYGNSVATFDAVAGETYYLVVDGYYGAVSDYTIDVTCGPPPEPDITVNPSSMFSAQAPDTVVLQTLTIGNIGGADLNWNIVESQSGCPTPGDIPWISLAPTGGTTPPAGNTPVDVWFDSTGMTPGTYFADLCVNSNDPDSPLVPVPLEMMVGQPATVRVGSGSVSPGGSATVPLEALGVPGAGVGAATIEVYYDTSVVQVSACDADPGGVYDFALCNWDNGTGVLTFSSISALGVPGDSLLADITFDGVGSTGDCSILDVVIDTFADPGGNPLPAVDEDGEICVGADGDVNCDGVANVIDAMFILQREVGLRGDHYGCPLPPPPPDLMNVLACDVSQDGTCDVVDALFILQCEVGIPNIFCPAPMSSLPWEGIEPFGTASLGFGATEALENDNWTLPIVADLRGHVLGAAAVEMEVDPAILKVVSCSADPNAVFDAAVCNVDAESGQVRLATVAAAGLTGQQVLGEIVFERLNDPSRKRTVAMSAEFFDPEGNSIDVRVERWRWSRR
jgi:hypothetical protein